MIDFVELPQDGSHNLPMLALDPVEFAGNWPLSFFDAIREGVMSGILQGDHFLIAGGQSRNEILRDLYREDVEFRVQRFLKNGTFGPEQILHYRPKYAYVTEDKERIILGNLIVRATYNPRMRRGVYIDLHSS